MPILYLITDSQSERFLCRINARSEKFAKYETIAINSLARLSERQRSLPALCRLSHRRRGADPPVAPITD